MGKVGDKQHFAENWQNGPKSVSEKMADARDSAVRKEAAKTTEAAAKTLEGMRANMDSRPEAKDTSAAVRENNFATEKANVESGRDKPQTFERVRPEVQTRGAEAGEKQSNEFLKNRQDAKDLKELQMRPNAPSKTGSTPTTKGAVTTKGETLRPDIQKQDGGKAFPEIIKNATRKAETEASREKAESHISKHMARQKGTEKGELKENQRPDAAKDAAQFAKSGINIAAAGVEGKTEVPTSARSGKKEETGKTEKKETRSNSAGKAAQAGGKEKARDLNSMLGGLGTGTGGGTSNFGEGKTVVDGVEVERKNALPERDPSLAIYSEFAEDAKDSAYLVAKAQVYGRMVEKRVKEIIELDQTLNEKIGGLFKDRPFSKRIIGDLKEDIKMANMLGSVYFKGGFRG